MEKKRIAITGAVFLFLAFLVYLQFRTWKSFDWATFWHETHEINKWHLAHGIGYIYVGYVLRAIRWKIFLRPVRPNVNSAHLIAPTVVGFTVVIFTVVMAPRLLFRGAILRRSIASSRA